MSTVSAGSTVSADRRGKLAWTAGKYLDVGRAHIALGVGINADPNAAAGTFQNPGIRPSGLFNRLAKEVVFRWRSRHGVPFNRWAFHETIGGFIARHASADDVFLDVGAGAMQIEPYVPDAVWYNALDIAYSDFQLRRIRRPGRFNLAMASITQIPLADDCVSVVTAAEMLQQVPPIVEALAELRRVLRPGGLLLCSIANSHQPKYKKVGPNPNQAHVWDRPIFERVAADAGFAVVEQTALGTWDEATSQTRREPPADLNDATHYCYVLRSTKTA